MKNKYKFAAYLGSVVSAGAPLALVVASNNGHNSLLLNSANNSQQIKPDFSQSYTV